jgi:hypothetical protein
MTLDADIWEGTWAEDSSACARQRLSASLTGNKNALRATTRELHCLQEQCRLRQMRYGGRKAGGSSEHCGVSVVEASP